MGLALAAGMVADGRAFVVAAMKGDDRVFLDTAGRRYRILADPAEAKLEARVAELEAALDAQVSDNEYIARIKELEAAPCVQCGWSPPVSPDGPHRPSRDEEWAVTIISCALGELEAVRDGTQPITDSAELIAACKAWLAGEDTDD